MADITLSVDGVTVPVRDVTIRHNKPSDETEETEIEITVHDAIMTREGWDTLREVVEVY